MVYLLFFSLSGRSGRCARQRFFHGCLFLSGGRDCLNILSESHYAGISIVMPKRESRLNWSCLKRWQRSQRTSRKTKKIKPDVECYSVTIVETNFRSHFFSMLRQKFLKVAYIRSHLIFETTAESSILCLTGSRNCFSSAHYSILLGCFPVEFVGEWFGH